MGIPRSSGTPDTCSIQGFIFAQHLAGLQKAVEQKKDIFGKEPPPPEPRPKDDFFYTAPMPGLEGELRISLRSLWEDAEVLEKCNPGFSRMVTNGLIEFVDKSKVPGADLGDARYRLEQVIEAAFGETRSLYRIGLKEVDMMKKRVPPARPWNQL